MGSAEQGREQEQGLHVARAGEEEGQGKGARAGSRSRDQGQGLHGARAGGKEQEQGKRKIRGREQDMTSLT